MKKIGSYLVRLVREWGPVIIAVLIIRSFLVESFMVPTGSMLETIELGDFMLVNKFIYGIKLPLSDRTIVPVTSPGRGDIVVFRFPMDPDLPGEPGRVSRIFPKWLPILPLYWDKDAGFFKWYVPRNFIKRCVAIGGDTVEYRNKDLYVNGVRQVETQVVHRDYRRLPGLDPVPSDFQKSWLDHRFYQTSQSPYIRDNFGPVVVPENHIFCMGDNRDNSEDSRFWGPLDLRYVKGKPLVLYFSSKAAAASATGAAPNILKIVFSPWAIRLNRIGHIVR